MNVLLQIHTYLRRYSYIRASENEEGNERIVKKKKKKEKGKGKKRKKKESKNQETK